MDWLKIIVDNMPDVFVKLFLGGLELVFKQKIEKKETTANKIEIMKAKLKCYTKMKSILLSEQYNDYCIFELDRFFNSDELYPQIDKSNYISSGIFNIVNQIKMLQGLLPQAKTKGQKTDYMMAIYKKYNELRRLVSQNIKYLKQKLGYPSDSTISQIIRSNGVPKIVFLLVVGLVYLGLYLGCYYIFLKQNQILLSQALSGLVAAPISIYIFVVWICEYSVNKGIKKLQNQK